MSAFGRGTVRKVLLSGLSAVAIACAASVAFADPLPPLEPSLGGEMRTLAPFASQIIRDRSAASPPPLWGRIKEGGRAVLRNKRAAHSIISSVRTTPHP
jgi:hypothetical protein